MDSKGFVIRSSENGISGLPKMLFTQIVLGEIATISTAAPLAKMEAIGDDVRRRLQ